MSNIQLSCYNLDRHCISCGFELGRRKSWAQRFRAIYSKEDEIRLSGIGLYEHYMIPYVVPIDETMRWDTPGARLITLRVPNNNRRRDALFFHESCWDLLQESFNNEPIPLELLFEACLTVPSTISARRGHEHTVTKKEPVMQLIEKHRGDSPYYAVDARTLLRSAKVFPMRDSTVARLQKTTWNRSDTFERLPLELREEVAAYLHIFDFYNLRLASRVMAALFSNQAFWATRFEANRERGFLCYLRVRSRQQRSQLNWQRLYHSTNQSNICKASQKRKEIWSMNQSLKNKTTMCLAVDLPGMSSKNPILTSWKWKEVQGNLNVLYKQFVSLPSPTTKMSFSILWEMDKTYITGIELIVGEKRVSIGYKLPEQRIIVDINYLQGFEVAIDGGGIRALRPITSSPILQWQGSPDGACITRRLVLDKEEDISNVTVNALQAAFDSYKMVGLAIGNKPLSIPNEPILYAARLVPDNSIASLVLGGIQDIFEMGVRFGSKILSIQQKPIQSLELRKNALWYPTIPEQELFLNEKSFIAEDLLVPGYRPLHWTLFGGLDGSELRFLTGISVTLIRNQPFRIKFLYNNEALPKKYLDHGYDLEMSVKHIINFPIDGQGGEIINTVEVAVQHYPFESAYRHFKQGVPQYYQLTTNWGRCCRLQRPIQLHEPDSSLKTLEIASGTTLVGFYGVKNYELGVITLGPISVASG